jgi:hypothetical protein
MASGGYRNNVKLKRPSYKADMLDIRVMWWADVEVPMNVGLFTSAYSGGY